MEIGFKYLTPSEVLYKLEELFDYGDYENNIFFILYKYYLKEEVYYKEEILSYLPNLIDSIIEKQTHLDLPSKLEVIHSIDDSHDLDILQVVEIENNNILNLYTFNISKYRKENYV